MRKRGANYPWNDWFERDRFTLKRGEDYDAQQASFSQQLRNAATRLRCKISLVEGRNYFEVIVRERDYAQAN